MLIAIVEIPRAGGKASKEQAIEGGKKSAPTYVGLKGLIRKDYLNGEEGGGGVYLWESREAADAWYTDEWWVWIEERFGAKPTLTYYDHYLTVDNDKGEVRVDGKPISLDAEAAE